MSRSIASVHAYAMVALPPHSADLGWPSEGLSSAGPNDLSFSSVYLAVKRAERLLDSGENHCEQIFACLPCWQWAIYLKTEFSACTYKGCVAMAMRPQKLQIA